MISRSATIRPVHYVVTETAAVVCVAGEPALRAEKSYQLIALAKDALAGSLQIPDPMGGEPIAIVDHAWLLRFAGDLCRSAAQKIDVASPEFDHQSAKAPRA